MKRESNKECHLVTGGGGYAGFHLGKALFEKGFNVVLLDVRPPTDELPDGINFIQGSISDYGTLISAFRGVDCVYHLASYGMSGREQLNKKLIEEVNVKGTENVIRACKELGICRLVYTSTYNVIFGGQEIKNGDESLPYLPLDQHPDHYSRTKSLAEMSVLKANGCILNDGSILKTCALRLAGVYGPGEQRHLPRIVGYVEKGLFAFTYGDSNSLVEFLHVDNLVQAHIQAGEALTREKSFIAAGQAYFISDCKPINNFEFFRPLVEGLGYSYPKLKLPLFLIYFIAFLTEWVHFVVGRVYNFQPLLTRTEVYKTGVTHYFNIEKARKDLGYSPTVQNDMDSVVKWYKDHGYGKKNRVKPKSSAMMIIYSLVLAIAFAVSLLSFLPTVR